MLLSTPFYRTLASVPVGGDSSEPEYTYRPYNIFLIETRLYPVVYKMFGRDIDLLFKTVHENNRMSLKIQVIQIPEGDIEPGPLAEVEMSQEQFDELQHQLDLILTENMNYSLIDKDELYRSSGKTYPRGWFNIMMEYIEIPSKYNPFIQQEGIYLEFDPEADYKYEYYQIGKMLLDTMEKYYQNGVVYGGKEIADRWNLKRVDYDELQPKLFRPLWKDKRFAPNPVEFLTKKIHGDNVIRIRVSDNLVRRHYIANTLSREQIPMKFEGSYVLMPANTLADAIY